MTQADSGKQTMCRPAACVVRKANNVAPRRACRPESGLDVRVFACLERPDDCPAHRYLIVP